MPSRGLAARAGGDEHHGVAGADDDGAVGLLGEAAGFDRERVPTDGDFTCMHVCLSVKLSCASLRPGRARASGHDECRRRPAPGSRSYLRMPRRRISSAYRSVSFRFR